MSAAKFKWTAKQEAGAKRTLTALKPKNRKTCERIAALNGCEAWEVIADSLATNAGRKPRIKTFVLDPTADGTDAPCTTKPNNAKKPQTEKPRIWRTVRAGGVRIIEAPDGTHYRGTAADVRDIAMYPFYRDGLADKLRSIHRWYSEGKISREQLRENCCAARREKIMYSIIARTDNMKDFNENERTMIDAAARATGTTATAYIHAAVMSALDRTRREIGGALPFTRHERAALIAGGGAI